MILLREKGKLDGIGVEAAPAKGWSTGLSKWFRGDPCCEDTTLVDVRDWKTKMSSYPYQKVAPL